jgi:CRISPR-associated protein Csd2
MSRQHLPKDVLDLYEVHDFHHASAILAGDFPEEFADLVSALRQFRFSEEQVRKPGGSESEMPRTFSALLRPKGWEVRKLRATRAVDDVVVTSESHQIDYVKGRVAFDFEWNSKDQTFDRDLFAFRSFFEYEKISVGVIVTRSDELQEYFDGLGTYIDKALKERPIGSKYGQSTTHMSKLLPRLEAGRGGGCPILALGITKKLLKK